MRGATDCARRLKALFNSLRSKLGKVSPPAGGDPVAQLVLGVLSRDAPESKAREALDRLRGMVVDYNELRVIPPIEMADMLGDYPDVRLKCEDISRSLNKVFALNHTVSLTHLANLSSKDVRNYLDRIDGLEPYTRARIRLLGLQQHAVPLDEAMWACARHEGIVDRRCPLLDAQSFLERQIQPEDALEFVALLRRHAWAELGAAVRRHEVERIVSVPPDRTARNMLQLVEFPSDEAALEDAPFAADAAADLPPTPAKIAVHGENAARPADKGAAARRASGRSATDHAARPAKSKASRPAEKRPATAKPGAARVRTTKRNAKARSA